MRQRDVALLAVLVAVVATGCSRLTFIKPNAQRKGMEQVSQDYAVRETRASRQAAEARVLVRSADQHRRAGRLAEAEADARAAIKADPGLVEAHTMLGLLAAQGGRAEAAGAHYRRAAELAPGNGAVLNNYGAWLCSNGQGAQSLEWFDRALADPGYAGQATAALANAGACAVGVGEWQLAEIYLRTVLAREPENPVALAAMSELQFRTGRYLEARAFSQRRLSAAPATAELLLLASQIETRLGDNVAAARYVQQLQAEFPGVGADTTTDTAGEPVRP